LELERKTVSDRHLLTPDSPVVLHTDHCAKKLLPWFDGMLDADEAYFKEHGEPLFSYGLRSVSGIAD
jgi:fructose-bisphosphate aldolase class II